MKKVVVCGGHLTPALALVDELRNNRNYEVVFFGRKKATDGSSNLSAEFREITKREITFVNIITGRLTRKWTKYSLASILKIPLGFLLSLVYLIKYHPSLVVSFGSYLSTPVVISSWFLGIDTFTHEQATVPGVANRINSLFVKKIFMTWKESQKFFPKDKSQIIGNLQPKLFLHKKSLNKKINKFLSKKGDMVFILGGSQGSHVINDFIFKNLDLFSRYLIVHQVGTANYKNDQEKAYKLKRDNYFPIDYVSSQDIGSIYLRSKFVISRSGANTVWDLATLAKPAILIPLPISASGEQMANAEKLEKAKMAIVLEQKNLTRNILKNAVIRLEKNYNILYQNAQKFKKILPQNPLGKMMDAIFDSP